MPVGDPLEPLLTVTVNVTGWPSLDGFGVEITPVIVEALFTVCERGEEVDFVCSHHPQLRTVEVGCVLAGSSLHVLAAG